MTLPIAAPRKPIHNREVRCQGFHREDGLWDIEATLVDTKFHPYFSIERGDIPTGEPIHDMSIRLTIDIDMNIREVHTNTAHTPFSICPNGAKTMHRLVGLTIGAGWLKQARQRIPNTDSCTHLMELLGPLSTTAYQTMHQVLEEKEAKKQDRAAPAILNQCHSLSSTSPVVKVLWPHFYTEPSKIAPAKSD